MSKTTQINFVGQPVLSQILDLIPKKDFERLVKKHQSDRYYKRFKSWKHLVTLLFGILSRCDSMREICEGLKGFGGKLNHLGFEEAPANSTAGDGHRLRDNKLFEQLYFLLVERYQSFLSVSRTIGLTAKELLIIDSTTIQLFSDLLKGAGRNPKNDGRKKGGLKVHMLIDALSSVARFVKVTEAKQNDNRFLEDLNLPQYSMVVFDKAYTVYRKFAEWTEKSIYFVTRQRENAVYKVLETIEANSIKKFNAGVIKEQLITIQYKSLESTQECLVLRRIEYQDEKNRQYVFLTNNMDISSQEVALIYKKRWGIELLFKKMKQNFQLHYFYAENENGIRSQVWCTLISQLLLTVLQKITDGKKAFSTIATIIRIHLISLLDVSSLITNTQRNYSKVKGNSIQHSLFPT